MFLCLFSGLCIDDKPHLRSECACRLSRKASRVISKYMPPGFDKDASFSAVHIDSTPSNRGAACGLTGARNEGSLPTNLSPSVSVLWLVCSATVCSSVRTRSCGPGSCTLSIEFHPLYSDALAHAHFQVCNHRLASRRASAVCCAGASRVQHTLARGQLGVCRGRVEKVRGRDGGALRTQAMSHTQGLDNTNRTSLYYVLYVFVLYYVLEY